jgi:hypothetical protein
MRILKFLIFIVSVVCFSYTGCLNTEGTLDIKGKVMDENTRVLLRGRKVIVQGLAGIRDKPVLVNAGQFTTDSSGHFVYTLKKIKDAYFYNFCFVGDSAYAFSSQKLGLYEIKKDAMFLTFFLNKLEDLTISIERKSKTPVGDILYLTWISDGKDGSTLYPYKLENYGIAPDFAFRWTGGKVKSVIRTKAYADKKTIVTWELFRNGKKKEITDTIICKRGIPNYVNFKY